MLFIDKLDVAKKELSLSINSFNEPTELVGKNAWIKLVLHLLYINKGTYPSNPDLGIGINTYDFTFMDDAIERLQTELTDQTRTYLQDIPINSIEVDTAELSSGKKALLIIITFVDDGRYDTAVVASALSTTMIDFEVSM